MFNKLFEKLFEKFSERLKSVSLENNSLLEIIVRLLVGIIAVSAILTIVFGFMYCIYYGIAWIGFWLFGPVIFGFTLTWKTPLMLWFIIFIAKEIFNRKGK